MFFLVDDYHSPAFKVFNVLVEYLRVNVGSQKHQSVCLINLHRGLCHLLGIDHLSEQRDQGPHRNIAGLADRHPFGAHYVFHRVFPVAPGTFVVIDASVQVDYILAAGPL